jgi:hypothetical protein
MELSCVTSSSSISGLHNVIATNLDATKVTLSGAFRYSSPPTITSISPNSGRVAGGNRATVNGSQFGTGTNIKVGEKDCLQVQVLSSTQLSCVLPAYQEGRYKIILSNQYGQESSDDIFYSYRVAPQVSLINPVRGSISGGGSFTVMGSGFLAGASVKIGSKTCVNPQIVSESQINCAIPENTAGSFPVSVTNSDGQSSSLSSSTYFEAVAPRWVGTNGGNCITLCSQQNLISKPSPEGAYCSSGEVIPNSARGVVNYARGCRPNRTCLAQGRVNGATSQAQFCYGPGQAKNREASDITMGCYCGL